MTGKPGESTDLKIGVKTSFLGILAILVIWSLGSGCSKKEEDSPAPVASAEDNGAWVPNISGVSASNHDSAVQVSKLVLKGNGKVIGLIDPAPANRLVSVGFTVPDLGANGSFALVGRPEEFPGSLDGNAIPVLMSLVGPDGKEMVPLATECFTQGVFKKVGSRYTKNSACVFTQRAAFIDTSHWLDLHTVNTGYVTSLVFPNCNWSDSSKKCGYVDEAGSPGSGFFLNGKLRAGYYQAKYMMLADSEESVSSEFPVTLRLDVTLRRDTSGMSLTQFNGAIDLNVFIVGSKNVKDSHTSAGHANLDALFAGVHQIYSQSGTGIRIGTIRVFEWGDDKGGEPYANIDIDEIGSLFMAGSQKVPSTYEGSSMNVFLVSSIPVSGSNGTILGVAGAIGGPFVNGTGSSGLAFATFDELAELDRDCSDGGKCVQDMSSTIAHELGHYLGLFHLNERDGTLQDPIPDTPICATETLGGKPYITHTSCLKGTACNTACPNYYFSPSNPTTAVLCPAVAACQFNHVMWYTGKNYSGTSNGDGNLFSVQTSSTLNYNPFVW